MSPSEWALAFAVFVTMEPITALTHRLVMHRRGMVWHRSHHVTRRGRFEANDLYPLTFATATIVAMAAGVTVPALGALLPIGVGVTAYGLSYAVVHELVIHRRLARLVPGIERLTDRSGVLQRLVSAHALHHRFGREPYGMLVPVVSAEVRARAADRSGSRSDVGGDPRRRVQV